jgi:PucR-like helix-turn-helix protein
MITDIDSEQRPNYAEVAAIVDRIPLAEAGREMVAGFRAEIAALDRLSESSQADVAAGVERNLLRWQRWLRTGIAPADADFDPLREWARARATEGVRLEDLLRAFGVGRQVGWELIRRYAREDETEALLDAAGLLMQYTDRVSTVVTDTYLAERDVLVSEEERRTRHLLERLSGGGPLAVPEIELAERLGVEVESAYVPFVVVMPDRPAGRHAALAARLRRRGWRLTITEGSRVVGLASKSIEPADLEEGLDLLLVRGDSTPRAELAQAREDIALLADHGRRAGLRGLLRSSEHLLEVLLGRNPGQAEALRERVLGPLSGPEHEGLRQTLRVFVVNHYDRAATSAALHVHRNTLAYRLRRIEELTGLRLDDARDLACVFLAVGLEPEQAPS